MTCGRADSVPSFSRHSPVDVLQNSTRTSRVMVLTVQVIDTVQNSKGVRLTAMHKREINA